eukprot:1133151-Pelagomonas_calceolata.AAC.5
MEPGNASLARERDAAVAAHLAAAQLQMPCRRARLAVHAKDWWHVTCGGGGGGVGCAPGGCTAVQVLSQCMQLAAHVLRCFAQRVRAACCACAMVICQDVPPPGRAQTEAGCCAAQ